VEQSDHHIQDVTNEQQPGGQAQQRAESFVVHNDASF
jgi:hypothetical protein